MLIVYRTIKKKYTGIIVWTMVKRVLLNYTDSLILLLYDIKDYRDSLATLLSCLCWNSFLVSMVDYPYKCPGLVRGHVLLSLTHRACSKRSNACYSKDLGEPCGWINKIYSKVCRTTGSCLWGLYSKLRIKKIFCRSLVQTYRNTSDRQS